MTNYLEIVERLRDCAEDPMWDNHVEVSKKLLLDASSSLEEVIKQLSAPTSPLKKSEIEAEYHRQVRAIGEEPRLLTFDAFLSGFRFAEKIYGITKAKE